MPVLLKIVPPNTNQSMKRRTMVEKDNRTYAQGGAKPFLTKVSDWFLAWRSFFWPIIVNHISGYSVPKFADWQRLRWAWVALTASWAMHLLCTTKAPTKDVLRTEIGKPFLGFFVSLTSLRNCLKLIFLGWYENSFFKGSLGDCMSLITSSILSSSFSIPSRL